MNRGGVPGGGVKPSKAAAGAHVSIEGTEFSVTSPRSGTASLICLVRLTRQEPSPEGRDRLWVDPTQSPWCNDSQLAPALAMRERGWR